MADAVCKHCQEPIDRQPRICRTTAFDGEFIFQYIRLAPDQCMQCAKAEAVRLIRHLREKEVFQVEEVEPVEGITTSTPTGELTVNWDLVVANHCYKRALYTLGLLDDLDGEGEYMIVVTSADGHYNSILFGAVGAFMNETDAKDCLAAFKRREPADDGSSNARKYIVEVVK